MKYYTLLKTILLSIATLLAIQSCQSGLDPKVESRKAEVMKIHDEVMPLMSTTRNLRKAIKNHNHGDADELISDLEAADEMMMQWMSDINLLPEDATVEHQLGFLEKMEGKAIMMQTEFDNAIKNAEKYVNNHKH